MKHIKNNCIKHIKEMCLKHPSYHAASVGEYERADYIEKKL